MNSKLYYEAIGFYYVSDHSNIGTNANVNSGSVDRDSENVLFFSVLLLLGATVNATVGRLVEQFCDFAPLWVMLYQQTYYALPFSLNDDHRNTCDQLRVEVNVFAVQATKIWDIWFLVPKPDIHQYLDL